jgi:hypothetical protein
MKQHAANSNGNKLKGWASAVTTASWSISRPYITLLRIAVLPTDMHASLLINDCPR